MIWGDTRGIEHYIGSVDGILSALQDPRFQGDFGAHLANRLQKRFMADTIAANNAGHPRLRHMFEWPATDGRGVAVDTTSDIPLFKLKTFGTGTDKIISFDFLPSNRLVPLPDPAHYGFKPEKLKYLSRHRFRMKALVMETMDSVLVRPTKPHGKLFLPTTSSSRGYKMLRSPVNVNPGGYSTGGFAEWWYSWFSGPAEAIVDVTIKATEEVIAATGQKVMRYKAGTVIDGKKVGGQFARATPVMIGYINAQKRAAEAQMKMAAKAMFNEWDGDE